MGFVNDTHMSQFIFPGIIGKSAGSWTPGTSSNVAYDARTAAAGEFTLVVPAQLPSNETGLKGAYLKSIDFFYSVAAAAAADFASVALSKMTLPGGTGSAPAGSAPVVTIDPDHDTAAKRKAVGEHKMTITLTDPEWIGADEAYVLTCVVNAAATTVFKLYGARANYTLRV